MGEEEQGEKENAGEGLEGIVEGEKPVSILRFFARDMEEILSDDERSMFYVNKDNDLVYASKAAHAEVGYPTLREIKMSAATRAKKELDRWIDFNRAAGNNEVITLDELIIPTHDGKLLTISNLRIRVYRNITTIEISHAQKRELKQYKSQVDYTFKAPAYLDIIGSEKLVKESKEFIQDLVGCHVNKKDIDVLRIKMHRLTHLGDGVVPLFSNFLVEPNLRIYKPNQQIYEKLIANNFPAGNIEGYSAPKLKQETLAVMIRPEPTEYKLDPAS